MTRPPADTAAPAFVPGAGARLRSAAPLGAIEFAVTERALPAVTQFEIALAEDVDASVLTPEQREQATATVMQGSGSSLSKLLHARQALLQAQPADVDVELRGVDTGAVVAALWRLDPGQSRRLTGLEGSVAGGQGKGIDPYRRQARPQAQQTSTSATGGMTIMLDAAPQQIAAPPNTSAAVAAVALQPWSPAQRQAAEAQGSTAKSADGVEGFVASALTQTYARFQADAGRTVGIAPGAAWRAALEAAAACGARQVLLGDRPAGATAVRLARAIWASWGPICLGALPAAAASALIVAQGIDSTGGGGVPGAVALAAAVPLAAAALPVAAPLLEVWRFSKLSAAEIEDTVRLEEPLQVEGAAAQATVKLWGEDALLSWPGAMEPVIHERDEFMARALAAAASGRPEGLTPAFVRADGGAFRYAMPRGGDHGVCPPGRGDGEYLAEAARAVVAVVGTAHVRGIEAALRRAAAPGGDVSLGKYL